VRRFSFFILFITHLAQGQDIHFSQFDYNPIFQNPGNVGLFDGDYRFHANYRDQWRSVTVPFQTLSISAEAKNVYKSLSFGLFLMNDVVGDGKFRTIEVAPSVAYVIKLTADSAHVIRPAIQMGLNYRQFDADAFQFDNQWNGVFFDPTLPTNEVFQTERKSNFTLGLGASYEYIKSPRKRLVAGIGLFNINRPNQGFFGETINRERRLNAFARVHYEIGFDWDIIPSLQMNFQGTYREVIIGSQARYILVDRLGDYKAFYLGAYLRGGDAGYLMAGMDYQNWWGGISYDLNFSKLYVASRARGGLELSVRYIIKSVKKRDIFYRVCPDYI
jgi:type IX secretion system PorP/SprF family membrane protein